MVAGQHRSRTMRRVKVRTPSGVVMHYRPRKPSKARCPETGEVLKGVPHQRPSEVAKLAKTQRRPQRPFGGVLSSKAARRHNVAHARTLNK